MSSASPATTHVSRETAGSPLRPVGEELRLSSLEPAEEAVVSGVEGEPAFAERLHDLGFVPGTHVRVVRRAPLGDPVEFELRGYRVCLRRAQGACVRVSRV